MYPKKIYLDYGSGWVDISHCVYYKSITITNRASSDDYHKAQDVASFTLAYHAATFSGIYNATSDIGVYIEDDLENRLFTGIIPPTMNRTYNGKLDNTTINLEATDSSESLKKEVGDVLYESYKIMDPANKSASIIHQLAYIAGFTDDQIDQTITIDISYDYFSPNNEKDKILEIMDVLLFENGYVFNMNEYDKISPVKWIDDASPAVEFNETNIVEEIEVNEQEIEFDAIDLYYYDIGSKDNVRIYTADLPFAEGHGYEGYPVDAGTFWPIEANATDRITGTNKVIYQEYEDVGIKYLTNEAISKGLDYNYKAFDSDFSSIVATKNHELIHSISGLTTVSGTFGNKKAHILYKNNTVDFQNIYYMYIDATVIYKATERLLRHGVAVDSERADKYNSYYIFDETSADKLSSNMVQMYKSGNTLYEFESETEAAPGTFAQVVTNDGTNQLCFVLERTYIEEKRMFKYKLKGYNYNEGVIIYEENKKHNSNNQVADVITVIEEVSSTIPDDVTAVSASAFQDSVNLTLTIPQASGVQNGIVGIIVQRSKDGGTNYYDILGNLNGIATVPPGNFQWLFNRSTDGYPEKTGAASPWIALENYRFRVKGVNAAGLASENWTYSGAPNVDNYKTWLSGTPANGRGTSAQRAVVARVDALGNTVYGYAGCDAQISMNGSDWFEPPSGLDSYASEDNWRQSIEEDSYKRILETQFQTSLPLAGQDDGLSTNTTYYFRFRYVTDRVWAAGSPAGYVESNGLTAGPWTSAITVVAMTGTEEDVLIALSQSYAAAPGILAAYSPKVLSEYPDDPAGTTYVADWSSNTDGFNAVSGCTAIVSDSTWILSRTSSTGQLIASKSISFSGLKNFITKIISTRDDTIRFRATIDLVSTILIDVPVLAGVITPVSVEIPAGSITDFTIASISASFTIDDSLTLYFAYIGTGAYLPGALRDITGNGYDLNVYSAVPVGEELYFNGENAYLRTENQVEMPDLFSISGKWVVPNNSTTVQILFYANSGGSGALRWYRSVNNRTLAIVYQISGGTQIISLSEFFPSLDTEAVYLEIGVDFPNEKLYVYKNGLKINEYDVPGIIKPSTSYWYFGQTGTSLFYMSGTLSLLCLWNVIHSPQEVLSHYQNPYGAMPKTLVVEQLLAAQARIIKGYMCYLAGGVNDEYNYRVFGNYEDLPVGQAIGENRFGTADKYVHFKPQADDDEADPLIKIMNGSVGLKMYGSVMDFNGTVKADALVGSTPASTVESNAADGESAYTGTSVYRDTNVPNGTLTRTQATTVAAANDGSREITLKYNLTALGSLPPDFLVIFYNIGSTSQSAPTVATNMGRVTIPISATGAGAYKFSGIAADKYVYFAIGMARNTSGGVKYSALQNFTQVTPGTIAIAAAATLGGVTGTNIAANDAWLRAGAPNGSFASHACTVEDNADGTINLNISWTFSQSTIIADRIILVIEKGTSNPGAVGTINDGDTYELPITQTTLKLSGLPSATLDSGTAVKLIYSVGAFAAKPNITGGISVGSVSSPAGWQNKSGTAVAIQINANNFINLVTGEVKHTIGEDKYMHLDPTLEQFILYNILYKTYQGKGVFRRALQIDAHNMDWLNSPVGGTEQLHGRIGRLGPYGPVLLDGPFETPIEGSWSGEKTIKTDVSLFNFGIGVIQDSDGVLRLAYDQDTYDSSEIIYSESTDTWSSPNQIHPGSRFPEYLQHLDGTLKIYMWVPASIVERTYNSTSGEYENPVAVATSTNAICAASLLPNGNSILFYTKLTTNYLACKIYDINTEAWGSEVVIIEAECWTPDVICTKNNDVRLSYQNSDGDLVERFYYVDTGSLSSESLITANAAYPSYFEYLDGDLGIAYKTSSLDIEYKTLAEGSESWSSSILITSGAYLSPKLIQVDNGNIKIFYIRDADNYLVERRLQRYAQLGAGVIESGHDITGDVESWWYVFSDGYMDLYIIAQYGPVTITDVYGPGRVSSVRPRVSFPVEFFTDVRCTINIGNTAGLACIYLTHNSSPDVDESQQYYLYSPIQGTVTGYTLYLHARGRVII